MHLNAQATIGLDRTPNAAGGTRFNVSELLSSDVLNSLVVNLTGDASASLKGLTVQAGSASMALGADLELGLYVQDLLDWSQVEIRTAPFDLAASIQNGSLPPGAVVVVLPDLGSLLDVRNLSFADLIDAVRFGLETIDQLAAEQPFYTAQLPIINSSLSELMVLGDSWLGNLQALMDDPVGGLDAAELAIEKALALPPELFDISIDMATGKLFLDVQLTLDYSNEFGLNLELSDLATLAGVDLPAGFGSFLDASGEGSVALALGFDVQLRLGLTLPKVGGQAVAMAIEDYNADTRKGTRLSLTARMVAQDVNLNFKVGPLEMGVKGGVLAMDADGQVSAPVNGQAVAEDPAALNVSWVNGAPVIEVIGALDITLPLAAKIFGKEVKIGQLQVGTNPELGSNGLAALMGQLAGTASDNAPAALVVKLPDFDLAAAGQSTLMQLLYDPTNVLDGVDLGLGAVQDLFQSSVAVDLPFIGTGLANTGALIANLRAGLLQDLRSKLSGEGKPVELIREELFKVFNGLGILQEQDGVDGISADDVSVGFYGAGGNQVASWRPGRTLPTGGVDSIRFDMNLGGRIISAGLDIPLNVDLPGFALDVDGGFSLAADWQYDFGFGLSASTGFFLGTNSGSDADVAELRMNVGAFLDGDPKDADAVSAFEGRGKLLFFEAAVIDHDTDLNQAGHQGSGLRGALNIDLKGNAAGQLTLDQVLSSPQTAFTVDFGVQAKLDLGVTLSAVGMPKLMSDLVVNWDWQLGDAALKFPEISIQNLRLDMQSAVADFLLPIASAVSDVAAPLRDIVGALTAPMPALALLLDPPRKALGLASDNTLRGFIDTVNELTRSAKPSLGLPRIDWSFLEALEFALDMPQTIKSWWSCCNWGKRINPHSYWIDERYCLHIYSYCNK